MNVVAMRFSSRSCAPAESWTVDLSFCRKRIVPTWDQGFAVGEKLFIKIKNYNSVLNGKITSFFTFSANVLLRLSFLSLNWLSLMSFKIFFAPNWILRITGFYIINFQKAKKNKWIWITQTIRKSSKIFVPIRTDLVRDNLK